MNFPGLDTERYANLAHATWRARKPRPLSETRWHGIWMPLRWVCTSSHNLIQITFTDFPSL